MWEKRREERRLPENAELRQRFASEQKRQVQETLLAAETLTEQNAARIERLRRMAQVFKRRQGT